MRRTFSPEGIFLLLADAADSNELAYTLAGHRTDAVDARMDAMRYRRQAASAAKEAGVSINGRRRGAPKINLLCYLTPDSIVSLPTRRWEKVRQAQSRPVSELALETVEAE